MTMTILMNRNATKIHCIKKYTSVINKNIIEYFLSNVYPKNSLKGKSKFLVNYVLVHCVCTYSYVL